MNGSRTWLRRAGSFKTAIVLFAMVLAVSALGASSELGTAVSATTVHRFVQKDSIAASPRRWGSTGQPTYQEIAFAPDGTLYASDCINARIYRISPSGHTSVFAGSGPGGYQIWRVVKHLGWTTLASYGGDGRHPTDALFSCPVGLAFDPAGDMFIADHGNGRIREIDTSGWVSTVAGVGPGAPWSSPWTPGVGPKAGDGGPAIHAILDTPWGITYNAAGDLFIVERDHDAVSELSPSGILSIVAGNGVRGFGGDGGKATKAELNRPLNVAIAADGTMYITDENNYRIRKVDPAGTISTVVGTGKYGCRGDGGPGTRADLKNPGDIVLAPDGSLLISDGECFRIRRLAPDGTISTFAGDGKRGCNRLGRPVSKLRINGDVALRFGPDGDLYMVDCNEIIRVDANGITHLVARAPHLRKLGG
jgi:hypothetical protein